MSALIEENSAYQAVTVMKIDWDIHNGGSEIAQEHDVRQRATLVMLSGGEEIGRVVASANRGDIEALFTAAI